MIRWNVARHMAKRGWSTAYQLAKESGISQPAAARVLAGLPLDRIDVATLDALVRAFRVKPWVLLEYTAKS
jgi:transcriptional regulator with XRE-family HTH domain